VDSPLQTMHFVHFNEGTDKLHTVTYVSDCRRGLDWMIGFIAPYTFTTRDCRQCSAIAILHTFQFIVRYTLRFSVFTSRILATDLSQSRCNFKSHMKSSRHSLILFLSLFCDCQPRRLDSIQFPFSEAHNLTGRRLETRLSTLCCSVEFFFITTLHWPHGKHHLLLSRILLGVFTAPLHSNGRGADNIENSLSIIEACLPRAPVYLVVA
jgi:hypothetical protein